MVPFFQVRVVSALSMKPPWETLKADARKPSTPSMSGTLTKPS